MTVYQTWQSLPLLRSLDAQTLTDIGQRVQRCEFRPGQQILMEGDQPPGLFIVLQGYVRLSCTAPDGREQVLDIVGPGEYFNAVPIFDGKPNPTTAKTRSHVECLLLQREDVLELIQKHSDFALAALRDMAEQLRELQTLVEDLAFRSVRGRLARQLLAEAREGTANMTHQELAERTGTVREIAGRALRRLAEEQLVQLSRGHIIVLDRAGLEQIVDHS